MDGVLQVERHTAIEDVVAVVTGTAFVAFGVLFLQAAGLATGGIVGLSLVVEYLTGIPFGVLFIVLNIPFYFLAWVRLGKVFTLSSIFAATSVSFVNKMLGLGVTISVLSPLLSGVIAGFLMGVGMLMLFRHRASLGGFNILAVYLQEKGVISAGKAQMMLDACILLVLALFVGVDSLLPSALSVVVLNLVLVMNHKNGRYQVQY
ncbi:YitT family protein [Desulfotalea psychrophila]|uniref:Conserved hypothetical membrane protein n=1 Tax=Desulfotalea psychrophila (strain LSv54 / DSM 12343) TaxID=177439 RepID=Q6APJ1_DESPS|nr:YitT family protein [Desulfotalea psychrophila]CAG35733.1 conserved hypothetical membrane protein [Desulfotalea psychrophila LSv54]